MPVLAPIDRLTHQVFRAAVLHLKENEIRRCFPTTLHVGYPGRTQAHVDRVGSDPGLRCDVAAALLGDAPTNPGRHRFAWLTRTGPLETQDCDLAWRSAITWAAQALEVSVHLAVVTRHGWFDPETGVSRNWHRLRRHSPDPPWPS